MCLRRCVRSLMTFVRRTPGCKRLAMEPIVRDWVSLAQRRHKSDAGSRLGLSHIAGLVAFLASPKAGWIDGQIG